MHPNIFNSQARSHLYSLYDREGTYKEIVRDYIEKLTEKAKEMVIDINNVYF